MKAEIKQRIIQSNRYHVSALVEIEVPLSWSSKIRIIGS